MPNCPLTLVSFCPTPSHCPVDISGEISVTFPSIEVRMFKLSIFPSKAARSVCSRISFAAITALCFRKSVSIVADFLNSFCAVILLLFCWRRKDNSGFFCCASSCPLLTFCPEETSRLSRRPEVFR